MMSEALVQQGETVAASKLGLPRYQQVKDYIAQRIAEGSWPPGTRLPSENQLTRLLPVSRMTVNRALRELAAEGLVRREQGVGSFVAEPKPQSALLEIRNIRDEIRERGHAHTCRVVTLARETAGGDVARDLEIAPGTAVFHSLLLHLEDSHPVALEDRYVNPAFAPGYIAQDFRQTTPFEYLQDLGPMDAAEHVIEAVRPTARVCRLLQVATDAPCLLLSRRTWSAGRVVSRARVTHSGSRYRLAGRQEYSTATSQGRAP